MSKYILDEQGNPVQEPDVLKWATWMESTYGEGIPTRRVAYTKINDKVEIFTSFLGIDHQWGSGPPLLYETMVFCLDDDEEEMERYSTREEAIKGHERMVQRMKERITNARLL